MVEKLRERLKKEGRSFKWFHRTYINRIVSYTYFIMMINDKDRMQESVETAIKKFLDVE